MTIFVNGDVTTERRSQSFKFVMSCFEKRFNCKSFRLYYANRRDQVKLSTDPERINLFTEFEFRKNRLFISKHIDSFFSSPYIVATNTRNASNKKM